MKKTAVVLFNLGGPDCQESVQPFLFNLFNDKAIISLPQPLRWFIAKMISGRRTQKAQGIYAQMGGGSPILPLTQEQAKALQDQLGSGYKVFVCMRYWHPMTPEVVKQVKDYAPDEVILLPLYPQFSTTTTGSSFKEWKRVANKSGLTVPMREICCYPMDDDFIAAHVELLKEKITAGHRVLFSAHGLPEKVIKAGDPYQWQVEQTVAKIVEKLAIKELDFQVCYQSRVGPLKWIGPSTEDEIKRAGEDKKSIILVPVAFVSEHSETLVELDIEYKELAHEHGVAEYIRIPALASHTHYVSALAKLCRNETPIAKLCPAAFCQCISKA